MFAELATQGTGFDNQVAAMTDEQAQLLIVSGQFDFTQTKAVDRGAMNGGQIGVVGFVAGIGDLPELFGRERMHQADFEAGLAKGTLDGPMIVAGAFESDDDLAEAGLVLDGANGVDGGLEASLGLSELGRPDERRGEEIGEHHFETCFRDIDAENAEVLRTHRLHALGQRAVGLLNQNALGGAWRRRTRAGHGCPPEERESSPFRTAVQQNVGKRIIFFLPDPHTSSGNPWLRYACEQSSVSNSIATAWPLRETCQCAESSHAAKQCEEFVHGSALYRAVK